LNTTATEQAPPAARLPEHVFELILKTCPLEKPIELIVRGAVPGFVIEKMLAALFVLTGWLPKSQLEGATARTAEGSRVKTAAEDPPLYEATTVKIVS
jgi:hypothetical protein